MIWNLILYRLIAMAVILAIQEIASGDQGMNKIRKSGKIRD